MRLRSTFSINVRTWGVNYYCRLNSAYFRLLVTDPSFSSRQKWVLPCLYLKLQPLEHVGCWVSTLSLCYPLYDLSLTLPFTSCLAAHSPRAVRCTSELPRTVGTSWWRVWWCWSKVVLERRTSPSRPCLGCSLDAVCFRPSWNPHTGGTFSQDPSTNSCSYIAQKLLERSPP